MCSPPRPGVALRIACALLALVAAACGDNNTTTPDDAAKSITSFAFLSASNAGLAADVTASISGTQIDATVPAGTDVTALVASFETTGDTVEVAGTAQVSGTTANDFSSTVTYTVTARDGSTASYLVNVTLQAADAKALTAFAFLAADNAALSADVTATINGDAIAATVPFGTDVTELVATFTTTGASVEVGTTAQVSGTTPNDFTDPVTYTVTAIDSSTRDYTVTITVAADDAKDLTAFSFLDADNAALSADVTATINGTAIAATVPAGTDVTALIATFTTTGQSVTVGTTAQVSGTTANDFTTAVTYTVIAADTTTQDYTVTVTIAPSMAKDLTAFSFESADNAGLAADVIATINGTDIAATVPFGTDLTALIATFTTTGQSVTVGATAQVSGTTPNDFTSPVTYTVTAADTSTQDYTVTVTVAPNTAKAITAFSFASADNAALTADVVATISGTDIAATVPFGTDASALVATFATTGDSVTIGGAPQASGMTANDFTTPVTYTVTAADTSTQDYTVTVTIASGTAKDITAFSFESASNPGLAANVAATITGTDITATLPFGTDPSALIATFATTGDSVTVGGTAQTSGITANDFTAPVTYTVAAADTSTQDYTVTVTVAANPAKDITAFSFASADNAGLSADVDATISGTDIAATVPFGTDVTGLVATFTTTGQTVEVGATAQVSGTTANDFTSPVTYTVTAADSSTQDYTVTITITPAPTPELLTFAFLATDNAELAADVTATIAGTAVSATVPFGTDVTALVATFTIEGVAVTAGGTAQDSGVTANDFTTPVDYTVEGLDADATYIVTVTIEPPPGPACGNGVVDGTDQCDDGNEDDGDGCSATCTFEYLTVFTFTGADGDEDELSADETTPAPGIASVPVMRRGGGVSPAGAANTFSASGWTTGSTIDLTDYYTFTLTPATGFAMTFSHLELSETRSNTGPRTFAVRSSLDNYTTNIDVQATHGSLTANTVELGAAFADLTSPVHFRIYAYGATGGSGTWRIDNVRLGGATATVPAP